MNDTTDSIASTKAFHYKTDSNKVPGELYTPVSIYLKVSDIYPQSALMESSDYHAIENSMSYIAICPLASIGINNGIVITSYPDRNRKEEPLSKGLNAEHVILVELVRNDLSRNCHDVHVLFYKEPQYYSHVIHLVNRVGGMLNENTNSIKSFIDAFPAGTLSGVPQIRAMQLISEIEPHNRGTYGGCIGFIGLNGTLNQAITIRTFVSRNNELWYQAGGGIVAHSKDEYELQEVNNKPITLRKAIDMAVALKNYE